MRTIFAAAPFGRYDMTGYGPPAYGRPVHLAGGRAAYGHIRGDLVSPPSLGEEGPDISALTKLIQDAMKDLPPEVLGKYQDRYKGCQNMMAKGGVVGLATGGKCLYDLYEDIKKEMKHPTPTPPPAPMPYMPPPAPGFPVLPVIAAVAGAGLVLFGVTQL